MEDEALVKKKVLDTVRAFRGGVYSFPEEVCISPKPNNVGIAF